MICASSQLLSSAPANEACVRLGTGYPGVFTAKAGTIDSEEDPADTYVPDIEIFTRSRAPWIPAIEGVLQESGDFSKESMAALGF